MQYTEITNTINSFYNKIKQREIEIIIYTNNKPSVILDKFYEKKEALEKHFKLFIEHKDNLDFSSIYDQHKTQYKKDLKSYCNFMRRFTSKYQGLHTPENKTKVLETKAHINNVKTGVNDSIKDLIIKPVPNCSGYSFGKYSDFDVIFRDSDGYINASKLCILGGKEYKAWSRNNSSQRLIKALKNKLFDEFEKNSVTNHNINSFEDIIVEDTISQENTPLIIWGTYVHPKLINSIAMWISEDFALKVADIVEEYFVNQTQNKYDTIIKDFQNKIVLKEDKIDLLLKKIENQDAKINMLLNQNIETKETVNDIDDKLKISSKSENENENIYLVLMYNNTGDDHNTLQVKNDKDELTATLYPFTFINSNIIMLETVIEEHKNTYPNSTIIFKKDITGVIMSLKNIKRCLSKKITFKNNNLYLQPNYYKTRFINDITHITDQNIKFIKNKTLKK